MAEGKRGRPPGSKNKKTMALIEKLDSIGAHPEIFLAEVMLGKSTDLSGLTNAQKMKIRVEAAARLMPFRWPKLSSIEWDLKDGIGPINIHIGADPRPGAAPEE